MENTGKSPAQDMIGVADGRLFPADAIPRDFDTRFDARKAPSSGVIGNSLRQPIYTRYFTFNKDDIAAITQRSSVFVIWLFN